MVLTAVDGEVGGVGAVIADVAQRVAPDREACTRWFVAGALVPIVTNIYEGQFLGVLLVLLLTALLL